MIYAVNIQNLTFEVLCTMRSLIGFRGQVKGQTLERNVKGKI